jgi:hypothetical protein
VGNNCGDISNCYSAGMATGQKYVGWLGLIINATGEGGGEGKTTEEMKDKATFAGWDFEKVWGMDENVNDGYPYLRFI